MPAPSAEDAQTYLGGSSRRAADVASALAAEKAAQAALCIVPADDAETVWDAEAGVIIVLRPPRWPP